MTKAFNLYLYGALLIYAFGVSLSQSAMSLAGALLCPVFVIWYFGSKRNRATLNRQEKQACIWGLTWVSYLLVRHLLAPRDAHFIHVLGRIPLYLTPLAAFFIAGRLSSKQVGKVICLAGVSIMICTAKTLYQSLYLGHPGNGFFGNPINFSYAVFPAFVFFSEGWIQKKFQFLGLVSGTTKSPGRVNLFIIAVMISSFLCLLVGNTRMIWILMAIYGVIRLLPVLWQRMGKKFVLISLSLAAILFWIAYERVWYIHIKLQRTFYLLEDNSVVYRWKAWIYNWNLFLQHPLWGVGPERNGIDPALYPALQQHWDVGHLYFAHSIYLQSLAESGFVGLILMLGYFYNLMGRDSLNRILVSFFLIGGITENVLNNSKAFHPFLFYSLLAILVSTLRYESGSHSSSLVVGKKVL